jgi:hypothetical protein
MAFNLNIFSNRLFVNRNKYTLIKNEGAAKEIIFKFHNLSSFPGIFLEVNLYKQN